jgi:hypothetical protein
MSRNSSSSKESDRRSCPPKLPVELVRWRVDMYESSAPAAVPTAPAAVVAWWECFLGRPTELPSDRGGQRRRRERLTEFAKHVFLLTSPATRGGVVSSGKTEAPIDIATEAHQQYHVLRDPALSQRERAIGRGQSSEEGARGGEGILDHLSSRSSLPNKEQGRVREIREERERDINLCPPPLVWTEHLCPSPCRHCCHHR